MLCFMKETMRCADRELVNRENKECSNAEGKGGKVANRRSQTAFQLQNAPRTRKHHKNVTANNNNNNANSTHSDSMRTEEAKELFSYLLAFRFVHAVPQGLSIRWHVGYQKKKELLLLLHPNCSESSSYSSSSFCLSLSKFCNSECFAPSFNILNMQLSQLNIYYSVKVIKIIIMINHYKTFLIENHKLLLSSKLTRH